MALTVHAAGTKLLAADHRRMHGRLTEVQYVHPDGDDTKDGMTWGTAKDTICAAYDALPSTGGTIYVAEGSTIGSGNGLWIVGPNDPNFASPPAGFRQQKRLQLIGIGGQTSDAFGPQTLVTNATSPYIWLAGTDAPFLFKDIRFAFPTISIRAGIASNLSSREINTSAIVFDHVSGALNQVAAAGPNIDLGYTFWLWFFRCGFSGNPNATTQGGEWLPAVDRKAAVVAKGAGDVSGGFVWEHGVMGGGWFRLYAPTATGGWGWRIRELLFEGPPDPFPQAPIELFDANINAGLSEFSNLDLADASVDAMVRVNMLAGHDPAVVAQRILCMNVSSVAGPATLHNSRPAAVADRAVQRGHLGNYLALQSDSARRSFLPSTGRFTNLAFHDSSSWTGAGATVTTGIAAPDGSTGAYRLSTGGGAGFAHPYRANRTIAVGDWMIGGVWVRSVNNVVPPDGRLPYWCQMDTAGFTFQDSGTNQARSSLRNVIAGVPGSNWQWVTFKDKVSAIGTNPADTYTAIGGSSAAPFDYYAPVFIHIPTGTVSDEEAEEIRLHLSAYPDGAPVGAASTLRNQKLIARGGLGVGNSASATTPGSVVRKMEVFSETGASLGFVPIYSSIT